MAETLVERRFVAVLAGEIVDYSRLLEDDEADALAALAFIALLIWLLSQI
jgi:hypothetical protein